MRPNKKNLAPIGELPTVAYYLKTAGEHFVKFAKKTGRRNPPKFDRCVKAVKKRGGANPYAVCTAAGTRQNVEGSAAYKRALRARQDARLAKIAREREARAARQDARLAKIAREREARAGKAKKNSIQRYKLNLGRTNPADAAAERYEYFHGRPPETDTVIKTPIHRHAVLSGIGELKELLILAISGDRKVRLEGFKGALLAETEKGTQLYIKGGDQSVNLKDFGITDPHESEILGALLNVVYFTTKDHLMPEDGGTANYKHKFVNEKLRAPRKYVFGQKGARLPMVGYDVRNKLLSIQGGTYKIVAEGIDG